MFVKRKRKEKLKVDERDERDIRRTLRTFKQVEYAEGATCYKPSYDTEHPCRSGEIELYIL